jgi:predicted phage terminase large subunit-like protein
MDELFALWVYLRWKCRNDLFFLGTEVLGYTGPRVDEIYHKWFCKDLEVDEDTMYLLPRDHTKTTWGIGVKVAQDIVCNPNYTTLIGSLTSKLSKDSLDIIKINLQNPILTAIFPEILSPNPSLDSKSQTSYYRSLTWRSDEIIVMRDINRREPTVRVVGIDGDVTGGHFERMYFDDIINEKTVISEVESEKAIRFFKYLVPMKEPTVGILRIYGTRYDPADLYAWVIDKAMAGQDDDIHIDMRIVNRSVKEPYETLMNHTPMTKREFKKRAVWDKADSCYKGFIYNFFNEDMLDKKRRELESDYIFYCQYYNTIANTDERPFPPPYQETDAVPEGLDFYLTIDPSFVPSQQSDFTALVVCGYKGGKIYVAEAMRMKGNPDLLVRQIYDLNDKYGFRAVGLEDGAWQVTMQWVIEYARKEQGRERLPIQPIKLKLEKKAKDTRIRGLSYFFKNNAVVLRTGLDDLKKELNRYPGNTRSKDDLLDALSMQKELISWRKTEEEKNEEYVRPRETYRMAMKRTNKREYKF